MNRQLSRNSPEEIARLVTEHRGLAISLSVKYAKRYPRIELDDLVQIALEALVNAARLNDPTRLTVPFAGYAMRSILYAIWHHVNRYGRPTELSLDEEIGSEEDKHPVTRQDVFDEEEARREESRASSDLGEIDLLDEIAQIIRTSPEFTADERRILRMQYLEGKSVPEIHKRIPGVIGTKSARAIRKLRSIMRARGYRALPPEARVIGPIPGRPRA